MPAQEEKSSVRAPAGGFPPVGYADWRRRVEEELGGAAFEDALVYRSRDGLERQPLYTAETSAGEVPGAVRPAAGWRIAQEIAHPRPEAAAEAMRADQDRGARLLWLRVQALVSGVVAEAAAAEYGGLCVGAAEDLEPLVAAVRPGTEVVLEVGEEALPLAALWMAAARRRGVEPRDLRGSFGCDPLGDLAECGLLFGSLDFAYRQMADLTAWTLEHAPGMRSVLVSTIIHREAGATAAQELAYAIATGVCYLRRMTAAGLGVEDAASRIDFDLATGRDLFEEIAKLRAARLLWAKVVRASGGGAAARTMRLHARSLATETSRLDPWMNLLRGGAQSLAAALGGADSVRADPHDEVLGWPSDDGRRLALDAQHILAEEARLGRVADPAGGSAYLESLTDAVARAAWEGFRELERRGGMDRALADGVVAEQIEAAAGALERASATRREAIVGASAFVNPAEEVAWETRPAPEPPETPVPDDLPGLELELEAEAEGPPEEARARLDEIIEELDRYHAEDDRLEAAFNVVELSVAAPGELGELMEVTLAAAEAGAYGQDLTKALTAESGQASCAELEFFRPAEAFEALRRASDRWRAERGRRPRAAIVELGERTDDSAAFVRRLLAAGGIEGVEAGAPEAALAAPGPEEVVALCGRGARDPGRVAELAPRFAGRGARHVLIAGAPGEHRAALEAAGATAFVFDGCDVVQVLRDVLEDLGAMP